MALEIERRFLVRSSGWQAQVCWQARLRQGYLRSDRDGFTLRVRLSSSEPSRPALTAGSSLRGEGSLPELGSGLATAKPVEQAWLTLKAAVPPPSAPSFDALDLAVGDPAAGDPVSSAVETGSLASPSALTRLEFEYAIPLADGEQLLALAGNRLAKCRYGLNLAGGDWVVDVFEAENAPLVVAEVELPHADARFDRPSWCGIELTGWHQLSNAALAQHPWSRWSAAEQEALLAGEPLGQGALKPESRC
jgi:adenylate cyclase